MPQAYITRIDIDRERWAKLGSKHGIDPSDLLGAMEGRRLPYKVQPDERGDSHAFLVQMDRLQALVVLKPQDGGVYFLVTARFLH